MYNPTLSNLFHIDIAFSFRTAFRVGTGRPGEISDLGVLRTSGGDPLVPGSSLKGRFRVSAERLAPHMDLTACLLDSSLSGVPCCSCQAWARANQARLTDIRAIDDSQERVAEIHGVTCSVCQLFGSPMAKSRVFFSDAHVQDWAGVVEVRDGVVLDRDAETAVPQLKFDYEVIPAGAAFRYTVDLEDVAEEELALVGAVLLEWEAGFTLGGHTSRGLGQAQLTELSLGRVDLQDADERRSYLLEHTMHEVEDWRGFFQDKVRAQLERSAGMRGEAGC